MEVDGEGGNIIIAGAEQGMMGGCGSITQEGWKVGQLRAVRRTQSSTQDKCRAHDPAEMPSCHTSVTSPLDCHFCPAQSYSKLKAVTHY